MREKFGNNRSLLFHASRVDGSKARRAPLRNEKAVLRRGATLIRPRQVFRREGDYWTIAFDGKVVRLRDTKGLRYLAELLRRPGEPLPASALVASAGCEATQSTTGSDHVGGDAAPDAKPPAGASAAAAERARVTVTKGIKAALDRLAASHPSLAAHLAATVRRGYVCTYLPDPRAPITWGH
jgi:hypothetical protein